MLIDSLTYEAKLFKENRHLVVAPEPACAVPGAPVSELDSVPIFDEWEDACLQDVFLFLLNPYCVLCKCLYNFSASLLCMMATKMLYIVFNKEIGL